MPQCNYCCANKLQAFSFRSRLHKKSENSLLHCRYFFSFFLTSSHTRYQASRHINGSCLVLLVSKPSEPYDQNSPLRYLTAAFLIHHALLYYHDFLWKSKQTQWNSRSPLHRALLTHDLRRRLWKTNKKVRSSSHEIWIPTEKRSFSFNGRRSRTPFFSLLYCHIMFLSACKITTLCATIHTIPYQTIPHFIQTPRGKRNHHKEKYTVSENLNLHGCILPSAYFNLQIKEEEDRWGTRRQTDVFL